MCKIALFREQLARAQASYTRRGCKSAGQNGFLYTFCCSIRFRIVERVAEVFIVVLVQPARRSRRTFDTDTKNNEPGEH